VQVYLFSFHTQPTLTEQVRKKLCCTFYCQPLLLAVYSLNHHHIDHASTMSTKAHQMEGSHHHHKDPHCRKTSEHHSNHMDPIISPWQRVWSSPQRATYLDHHNNPLAVLHSLFASSSCIISTSSGVFSFVLYFSLWSSWIESMQNFFCYQRIW
jgi:hypothetical protein